MIHDAEQLPRVLRIVMLFIDRVGFPVLAFILMFYMSFFSMQKVTTAMTDNTRALTELVTRINDFQKKVDADHGCIVDNQKVIVNDIKQLDRKSR